MLIAFYDGKTIENLENVMFTHRQEWCRGMYVTVDVIRTHVKRARTRVKNLFIKFYLFI